METKTIYCTSFCNFGHVVETGRPVGHECYILPPAMLKAEMEDNYELALEILTRKGKGPIVRGRRMKS